MTISRRAAGATTRAVMHRNALRHARLTLLAAAQTANSTTDPVSRADARTSLADCRAALDDLRSTAK